MPFPANRDARPPPPLDYDSPPAGIPEPFALRPWVEFAAAVGVVVGAAAVFAVAASLVIEGVAALL